MKGSEVARRNGFFSQVQRDFSRGAIHFIVPFIAGLAVLIAMRFPLIEASLIGQPDREMIETAFQIRADLVKHVADPLLLIDIDNESMAHPSATGVWPAPPTPSAPRGIVASALAYILNAPPGRTPTAVIVDVDIANPTDDAAAVASLRDVLLRWRNTKTAPLLIISREALPASALGVKGDDWILPSSPYDDIIGGFDGNIRWGGTRVLADREGVVREFQPVECVNTRNGVQPLFSSAILAYRAAVNGDIPQNAPIRQWLGKTCKKGADVEGEAVHGELINYHLSLTADEAPPIWADLPPEWPGYKTCGQNGGAALAQIISAATIAEAGPDADPGILCRRLVVIGGTNGIAQDFQHTPVHQMAGVMIVANAARGLELSHGGLKRVPLWLQILTIYLVATVIWLGFRGTDMLRRHYQNLRSTVRERHWVVRLRVLPFNPVVLHWVFAFAAYWLGVLLLLRALDMGYWGYLSAPAFAAATAGLIQEVSDEGEELEEDRRELMEEQLAVADEEEVALDEKSGGSDDNVYSAD